MGCGMIIAVEAQVSSEVCSWLQQRLEGTAIIGEVVDNGHKLHTLNQMLCLNTIDWHH